MQVLGKYMMIRYLDPGANSKPARRMIFLRCKPLQPRVTETNRTHTKINANLTKRPGSRAAFIVLPKIRSLYSSLALFVFQKL